MSGDDDDKPDIDYTHPLLNFPTGSGDKNCVRCNGRGVVPIAVDVGSGVLWPGGGTEDCICVFRRDLLANVSRIWKVLLTVESVEESPLLQLTKQSLWITSSQYDFRRHMRFVAFRKGPKWDARVIADATLMTAWLSNIKDVHDADVLVDRERPSEYFSTLVDIAVPFKLLVIQLGVKAAANKEMANVLVEALREREQVGLPTWVVDSPTAPVTNINHKCHSVEVMELLRGFRRVVIGESASAQVVGAKRHSQGPVTASPYTRRKVGMLSHSAPQTTPQPKPVEIDPDEHGVDALHAEAYDPALPPPEEDISVEDFPEASELNSNAGDRLPKFLGNLTREDRVAKQKRKKWSRNRGGDQ